MRKIRKYKVLGICAGQGALLFPFRHHLLANIEPRGVFHTRNEEQWKLNFGDIPFIREGLPDEYKPDIILSSPDCGASSTMRLSKVKILGKPQENKSINLVIQGILKYEPQVFFIENVPRLLTLVPEEVWRDTFQDYDLKIFSHSVSEFGNSQVSRKRLVILGTKKGSSKSLFKSFKRIFKVNNIKNSSELLEVAYFKGNKSNYMPPLNKKLAMYDYRSLPKKENLTVKEIQKLWTTDFKNEKKWPIKTAKMNTLPGVYRLDGNLPPLTLRPADRQFRPDGYPLGILDFRNIMGFPKRYKIYMDESNYLYWINKARYTFAKGACYEMGLWFKKCWLRYLKSL